MLKNYFKIAIAVLKRRKFFTFISLFGISFTLTILMVATAFTDKMFSPDYPDYKRARSLYITRVQLENSKDGWINVSSASYHLLSKYISKLKTPEKVAIFTFSSPANTYINNKKLVIEYKYTNADYWDVAEYQFLEGKPYSKQQIEQAAHVAVITAATRKNYFGDVATAVGKYIEADNVSYRVVGVVKDLPRTLRNFYADLYLPYTVSKSDYKEVGLLGGYGAVLLARSEAEMPKMKAEYEQMIAKVPHGDKEFDLMYVNADTSLEAFSRNIFGNGANSGIWLMITIMSLVILLFLLLPTINLININITRIMERSSEIGVRKAFGASSRTLVYQFVVENIILTLLGGLIGVVLSIIVIYAFNQSNLVPNLSLSLNLTVLSFGLVICLLFGLLSGVYPAWRMSRLNVVTALKSQ
ncbi:ABC transporter permease [Pedobacter metabolipauper]|uniref:Putative ABC transport system permease protein n=1 Tax=Pedobacter metabolipauper TaxID=425513 RepID=A0A4R6T1G2_9SPHI|nr:ABC transporter permease [Pedobacter metabolipauper]TDQ11909.1 putative ABC transport system permease protein [Pedobacter metabolipauper]